jgi:hypothetical protein
VIGALKLPLRRLLFWVRWRSQAELLDAAHACGMAPFPPDRYRAGEKPQAFRDRLLYLMHRYTQPPETPAWMLPANVDEFLARTEPRG